jgi:hypothetical protein
MIQSDHPAGKRMRRRRGGANRLINCRRDPPAKVLAARISMSHLGFWCKLFKKVGARIRAPRSKRANCQPNRPTFKLCTRSEIDAFSPGDQALHIGTAEAKLPHAGILNDLLPRPYTGKRSVNWHEASYPVRVSGGESLTNHVADVVGHEIGMWHS